MQATGTAWTDPPAAPDIASEYQSVEGMGGDGAALDWPRFWSALAEQASALYHRAGADSMLVEFEHGPASYLYDAAGGAQSERTVLVACRPVRPRTERDSGYQAGYPLPEPVGGRPVDRGHFVPHSGGGLFGPNLFVQDRALNRGWSRQGRLYRALETRAVVGARATMFVRPEYDDGSDVPAFLDLGVIDDRGVAVHRFRNRYDRPLRPGDDELEVALNGAVSAQVGALGEETAAAFLTMEHGATVVAMGDAGLPRDGARQDLDVLAVLDGALIAFEIKTRFMGRAAGRHTRAGNLPRPRMRRASMGLGPRQGSQEYVAARLKDFVDVGGDYGGVEVRVAAVDFRLMEIQQFALNDSATLLTPIGGPADCREAARLAFSAIVGHRGHL